MSGENSDQNQRAATGLGSSKHVALCPPSGHCIQGQRKWRVVESLGLCSESIPSAPEERDFPGL